MAKSGVRVTPAKQWRNRARKTSLVELPSGLTAELQPVSVDSLITSGELPDLLSMYAAQTLFSEVDFDSIADEGKTSKGYVELVNVIVPHMFVNPRVVEHAEAHDEIELSDIDWADKVAVFQLALLPVDALALFRPEQKSDVENVPDGDGDADTS